MNTTLKFPFIAYSLTYDTFVFIYKPHRTPGYTVVGYDIPLTSMHPTIYAVSQLRYPLTSDDIKNYG